MLKTRTCVFPVAVLTGFMFAPLIAAAGAGAANLSMQEPPPQTEAQFQARSFLSQGVLAFKNGHYDEAIADFRRAKQLDPQLLNARLYLATACSTQYIPGDPSEENRHRGESAIAEYRDVLTLQADNIAAIDGMGALLFSLAGQPYDPAKFVEAKSQFQKHIQFKPHDPEPYYWVGVIDWTLSFRANKELRERFNKYARGEGLTDTDPLPAELRDQYAREYGAVIEEGIECLRHAIELRTDYDDAMVYLNLLYRRKADTVGTEAEREHLEQLADDLIDKVKVIKEKRMRSQQQ